jgi:hypothetical protein
MNFEIPFAASKTTIARDFVPIDPSTGLPITNQYRIVMDLTGKPDSYSSVTRTARFGLYSKVPMLCYYTNSCYYDDPEAYTKCEVLHITMCPWEKADNWYFILGEENGTPFVRQGRLHPYRDRYQVTGLYFTYKDVPWNTAGQTDSTNFTVFASWYGSVTSSEEKISFYHDGSSTPIFRTVNGTHSHQVTTVNLLENNNPFSYDTDLTHRVSPIWPTDPTKPLDTPANYVDKDDWINYCVQEYPELQEDFT